MLPILMYLNDFFVEDSSLDVSPLDNFNYLLFCQYSEMTFYCIVFFMRKKALQENYEDRQKLNFFMLYIMNAPFRLNNA